MPFKHSIFKLKWQIIEQAALYIVHYTIKIYILQYLI